MILFSDRGTPNGYFREHGYSGHTFKFVNAQGQFHYVQIHVRADKGFHTFNNDEAGNLAGANPDYGIQDLFEAIEKGETPSWTVYIVRFSFASKIYFDLHRVFFFFIANDDA